VAIRAKTPAQTKAFNRELLAKYKSYNMLLEGMIDVSRSTAGIYSEAKSGWASAYFTRLCVLGRSLSRILPLPSDEVEKSDHWDLSSIAMISRSVLDCCLLFFYLGIEETSAELWKDKLNLFHLHDCTARASMFRFLMQDEKQATAIEAFRVELVEKIGNSTLLAGKSEREKQHILKGKTVSIHIQDDILNNMGVDLQPFRAWYEYMSAHVHSFPMATHRMLDDNRGNGLENDLEKVWISGILGFLIPFLGRALTQYLSISPGVMDPRNIAMSTFRKI
jgi:hypothetical protein